LFAAIGLLGFVVAAATSLAGYGVFKGSTDAGRAGRGAEVALDTISKEVTQVRVFLTNTAWPEVNKTLIRFRGVLDSADVFLVTSTFTVKVLALFLILCAAYMTHKLMSARAFIRRTIENTLLQILYSLCMVVALVLVLQLVKDLFHLSWPNSVPFVFLIPSLTTLAILYQHFVVTVKAILVLLRFIPYVIIEIPINMGLDPVKKGSKYMMNIPLQLVMCVIYFILYLIVPYGAGMLLIYLISSEQSILRSLLIGYGIFYVATLLIGMMGAALLSSLIRPVWAFLVRRNI